MTADQTPIDPRSHGPPAEPSEGKSAARKRIQVSHAYIYALSNLARGRPWLRWSLIVSGALIVVGALVAVWIDSLNLAAVVSWWVAGPLILSGVYAGDDFDVRLPPAEPREIVEEAAEERAAARSPEELIESDANRLGEYYALNLGHARASFRAALAAMILGFVVIVGGVVVFWFRATEPDTGLTALSVGAGVLTNILGTVFLRQNGQAQAQSLTYFDRLDRAQKLLVAIKLAGADAGLRTKIVDALIENATPPPIPGVSASTQPPPEGNGAPAAPAKGRPS